MHGFINLKKFTRTLNLAFVRTYTFRMKSTESFINKTPGLLLSGPKSSFQMKVNFAFHLEIKVPESGGREERHRIQVA